MIEWVIGFLVAKWWVDKDEKKKVEQEQNLQKDEPQVSADYRVDFGYTKNDETIRDLI